MTHILLSMSFFIFIIVVYIISGIKMSTLISEVFDLVFLREGMRYNQPYKLS